MGKSRPNSRQTASFRPDIQVFLNLVEINFVDRAGSRRPALGSFQHKTERLRANWHALLFQIGSRRASFCRLRPANQRGLCQFVTLFPLGIRFANQLLSVTPFSAVDDGESGIIASG